MTLTTCALSIEHPHLSNLHHWQLRLLVRSMLQSPVPSTQQ